MTDVVRSTRTAQDRMVLLAVALSGIVLVLAGGMLPIPMIGCLGLPLALIGGLAFAIAILACGRLEVPSWRQAVGVFLAVCGIALFARAYLGGLGIIAEHFLGRAGAPPLSALWRPALSLGLSAFTVGAAAQLRRRGDHWVAFALSTLVSSTGLLAWAFLTVLGILGAPFGA